MTSGDAAVIDRGSGLPLVLMHGTLMDHTMFQPQYDALSDEFRVVAFDLRARTDRGLTPYDLDDLADDCCRVMEERGIERFVVGGMSMGAFAALRVALRHPHRVGGIVLIGGQAQAFSAADREMWAAHYAQRRGQLVGREFAAGEGELNFHRDPSGRSDALVGHWRERFAGHHGDALHLEVESWLHMEDVRDRLDGIGVPTLVVHGDRDASIPVELAVEMYRLIPDAELLVLPRTGHAANLERPEAVNLAIRELMRRVDAS